MSLLPSRRPSLCLFCAFTQPLRCPPNRLLPRVQIAYRSATSAQRAPIQRPEYRQHRPVTKASGDFLRHRFSKAKRVLSEPESLESLQLSQEQFDLQWKTFEDSISVDTRQDLLSEDTGNARGRHRIENRLRQMFYAQTFSARFTAAELENQTEIADLRYPAEWYPATRMVQRTVHMHVGPTNSGKTYRALKRLEEVDKGIYLGPLRLLAHEVYSRLNAKGKLCALVTGEEQRIPQLPDGQVAPNMYSCTVEMAPLNTPFDVAVIDEIQMINHDERGWAWTQAFLGIQAKEIHLCGEARTVPLMRELCASVGDIVHVHEYERLSPLKVAPKSLSGKLLNLEKGDCVVAFSVLGIHALRREIEAKTGKKCAIVYGSLPPETRAQQARLFNDPDNDYDFLVASDAIGMGLNLAIKRVIFESTFKNNGQRFVPLQVSEIKQIAGRAGRFKTAHQAITKDTHQSIVDSAADPAIGLDDASKTANNGAEEKTMGWVTTLDKVDHRHLTVSMNREPEPIKTAGLFPPSLIVERFANYFPPGTPFSYIMLRLHEISEIHPRFHLCGLKDQLGVADVLHSIKNLSIQDRITICAAPINTREPEEKAFLKSLAMCIAERKPGGILDLEFLPLSVMDKKPTGDREYLLSLEKLHKMLVCYLWLSYRFPNALTTRSLASYTKKLVEDQIEKTLLEFSVVAQAQQRAKMRAQRIGALSKFKEAVFNGDGSELRFKPIEHDDEGYGSGEGQDTTRELKLRQFGTRVQDIPPLRSAS